MKKKMTKKMYEASAADEQMDKKMGTKEGSPKDEAMDKKMMRKILEGQGAIKKRGAGRPKKK